MNTVLIAEDEKSISEFIAINLRLGGYDIIEAADGDEAIAMFDANEDRIDIALLDIMMPGKDGIEVCRHIRNKNSNTGIIFLSAKTQERDKIDGLVSGADDYITKPFSPSELLARIEVLLRRVSYSRELLTKMPQDIIVLGNFKLDLKKHCLLKGETTIELTQTEYLILECFFNNPGVSVDRSTLLQKVWGDINYGDDKLVDVNIRRLRLKIEDDPSTPVHLLTVWGQGYKWAV